MELLIVPTAGFVGVSTIPNNNGTSRLCKAEQLLEEKNDRYLAIIGCEAEGYEK